MQLYLKENTPQVFSSEYCDFFKNTCFEEHLPKATSDFKNNYRALVR